MAKIWTTQVLNTTADCVALPARQHINAITEFKESNL